MEVRGYVESQKWSLIWALQLSTSQSCRWERNEENTYKLAPPIQLKSVIACQTHKEIRGRLRLVLTGSQRQNWYCKLGTFWNKQPKYWLNGVWHCYSNSTTKMIKLCKARLRYKVYVKQLKDNGYGSAVIGLEPTTFRLQVQIFIHYICDAKTNMLWH